MVDGVEGAESAGGRVCQDPDRLTAEDPIR